MRFLDRPWVDRVMLAGFRWETRDALLSLTRGLESVPAPPKSRGGVLYVHIPFCEVLCPFCSFHRVRYEKDLATRYFEALRREIRHYKGAGFEFKSLYVGGGTPTVAPGELLSTLALVRELFGVKEISVESNPKDLTEGLLTELAAAGVDRLSVGVQSFDDRLLREMGRYGKYGSADVIQDRLRAALPHFATLNVDMIFNLPDQGRASLEHDLDVLLELGVNQTSFYPLMTTGETAAKMRRSMGLPDKWRVRPYYETILARLRPTFHASSAWCFSRGTGAIDEYFVESEDYVGTGSGAFSYLDGTLFATTFSLEEYIARVNARQSAITAERHLSPSERMKLSFLVRLFSGELDKRWVRERYGKRFERELWPVMQCYKLAGALVEDATSYRLTDRGLYFWVVMMSSYFESVNRFREQMRARANSENAEPLRADLCASGPFGSVVPAERLARFAHRRAAL
jgi:menaquinone C8-methyltransferase